MRFCPKCRTPYPYDRELYRYCTKDGATLEDETPSGFASKEMTLPFLNEDIHPQSSIDELGSKGLEDMWTQATGIDANRFYKRSEAFLRIVHSARDLSVSLMPVVPPYKPGTSDPSDPDPTLEANRVVIKEMLGELAGMFAETVPSNTKVWTALRDRRVDNCYHTFERAGRYQFGRAVSSQPMHKDESLTVRLLKRSYYDGSCVVVSGSKEGSEKWQPHDNDKHGEDLSVLMGAVMTRSPKVQGKLKGWKNPRLTWIVFVNADKENAFQPVHIPLMRACVVVFSWMANCVIRSQVLNNITNP